MVKDAKARSEKAKIFSFVPTGEYYFHKGINAYDRFDLNNAKKYLKRALDLEPLEPMIACQLALVYTESGEYTESNALLNEVIKSMDSHMTECHYFLANNYAYLGMFTEAYKHAKLYLEKDKIGEFFDDAKELLEVIGIGEEEELKHLEEQEGMIDKQEKAKALLESGDFNQAVELLEETVADYPEFWPAYNNLALAYFYEGETAKAAGILEKVLDRNPGNLHALCNLAIFLFYEQETERLQDLLETLDKVQPILFEHRYKLGATFALTEQYGKAYSWLRRIQKSGYDEDEGFYYWLAKSAFQTGHTDVAQSAWEQLVKLNPNKADFKPWQEGKRQRSAEDEDLALLKGLYSEKLEERLYSIFLISISKRKQELITHDQFKSIEEFSLTEKIYLAMVLQSGNQNKIDPDRLFEMAHETALLLNLHLDGNQANKRAFLLNWFKAFIHGSRAGETFTNPKALAAAIEYIGYRLTDNKITQNDASEKYGISVSTLRKYIQVLGKYMV